MRAPSLIEVSALRERLRLTRAEIADLQGQLRGQRARTAYARVAVLIRGDTTRAVKDDGTWSVSDAARDAVRVLETLAGVLLVAGAIVIPVALAAAGLGLFGRRWTRRRRERVLDAP